MHQQSRSQACNEPHHVQALMTWQVPPTAFVRRFLTILVCTCFLVMFIHTHELFPKPLLISSHLKGILSPAIASFRRSEHTRRSLTEKETTVTEKDRQVAELQRQVAELQTKVGGTTGDVGSTGTPPAVPDNRAGALYLWPAKPLQAFGATRAWYSAVGSATFEIPSLSRLQHRPLQSPKALFLSVLLGQEVTSFTPAD